MFRVFQTSPLCESDCEAMPTSGWNETRKVTVPARLKRSVGAPEDEIKPITTKMAIHGGEVGKGDTMQARSEIQFKVGDKAVYPAQGVAEVVNIEEKDIAGNRQRFYVLRILDTDRKIMVPVSNASAVGLRQVISEQEIREIFDILRERTIAFDNQTWNRRYRGFMDKIKTGSIYDVAEVLRDLYRLKTDKQLSFGERRMLDTARTLIVKEIAIARSQTEEQVKTEIEAIFLAN
jgi:CarD family transcriptional regulator